MQSSFISKALFGSPKGLFTHYKTCFFGPDWMVRQDPLFKEVWGSLNESTVHLKVDQLG